MVTEVGINEIRWKCRRGILELDYYLGPFVEDCYADLSPAHKEAFAALLDAEDPVLLDWVSGRGLPDEEVFREIVALIRAHRR